MKMKNKFMKAIILIISLFLFKYHSFSQKANMENYKIRPTKITSLKGEEIIFFYLKSSECQHLVLNQINKILDSEEWDTLKRPLFLFNDGSVLHIQFADDSGHLYSNFEDFKKCFEKQTFELNVRYYPDFTLKFYHFTIRPNSIKYINKEIKETLRESPNDITFINQLNNVLRLDKKYMHSGMWFPNKVSYLQFSDSTYRNDRPEIKSKFIYSHNGNKFFVRKFDMRQFIEEKKIKNVPFNLFENSQVKYFNHENMFVLELKDNSKFTENDFSVSSEHTFGFHKIYFDKGLENENKELICNLFDGDISKLDFSKESLTYLSDQLNKFYMNQLLFDKSSNLILWYVGRVLSEYVGGTILLNDDRAIVKQKDGKSIFYHDFILDQLLEQEQNERSSIEQVFYGCKVE